MYARLPGGLVENTPDNWPKTSFWHRKTGKLRSHSHHLLTGDRLHFFRTQL